MSMPTLIVEIGFSAATTGTALFLDDTARGLLDTNTLAAGDLFVDVTQWVTSITTRRGATRSDGPPLRYEAGTCTITFRNDDRRFDPSNLSGPYVAGGATQVEPLRAVRIRATWNGRTYPLWRGYTDQWSVAYDGPNSSVASVTCFDAFGVFSAHNRAPVAAVGAGETSSARVTRILDGIAWPAGDRMIGTGEETVQATTLEGSALDELLTVADTELGELWMDAQGRVTFRPRSAGYTSTRSGCPQAQFGDQVVNAVDTTINVVSNPSVENDLTGWGTGGSVPPTITRTTTQAKYGTTSILATWGAAGSLPHVRYDLSTLVVGRDYTVSVWLYVPSGSLPLTIVAQGTFGGTTSTVDQWERITWTGSATSSSFAVGIWPVGTPVGGETFYVDGLQIEEGTTATAYTDGDQLYSEWDGVAHASTSRRLPELPYSDAGLAYDALSITNFYRVTRVGGVEQTVSDSGSVSAFLTRSTERSDLLMQTDAEAKLWAEQLLARTAQPELRFASLSLTPNRDADRLWPQAFGREIGDRIRLIKRPPGGGSPIRQEAWVRGVEHRLTPEQDWQTTFVLEQARSQVSASDTFGRTVSNGWGSADSGQAWSVSGGAVSDYSVASGAGRQQQGSVNVLRQSFLTLGGPNHHATADFTCPVTPTGAAITLWVAVRAADTSNHYLARLIINTTGSAAVALFKRTGGTLSASLASVNLTGTHTTSTVWRLAVDAVGTTLRAKAWRIGTDLEPGWLVTVTDSTFTTGNQVGVLSRLETGNTNTLPVVITIDNFTATAVQTWT